MGGDVHGRQTERGRRGSSSPCCVSSLIHPVPPCVARCRRVCVCVCVPQCEALCDLNFSFAFAVPRTHPICISLCHLAHAPPRPTAVTSIAGCVCVCVPRFGTAAVAAGRDYDSRPTIGIRAHACVYVCVCACTVDVGPANDTAT